MTLTRPSGTYTNDALSFYPDARAAEIIPAIQDAELHQVVPARIC